MLYAVFQLVIRSSGPDFCQARKASSGPEVNNITHLARREVSESSQNVKWWLAFALVLRCKKSFVIQTVFHRHSVSLFERQTSQVDFIVSVAVSFSRRKSFWKSLRSIYGLVMKSQKCFKSLEETGTVRPMSGSQQPWVGTSASRNPP